MAKWKVAHRYSEALYEVASVMNSVQNSEDVLASIVEKVTQALSAKGCSIMLLTTDKQQMYHTVSWGLSDWYIRRGPYLTKRSIAEMREDIPVIIFDASRDSRLQYPEHQMREGVASILSVPMILREEIIGVMRVYTSEPRYFTSEEIQFVSAVANLGAITLENIELHKYVHMDYETIRRKLLEWRAAFSHEWVGRGAYVVARDWWKFF